MWISGTASWMFVVTARHATYPHITRLNNDKPFYFDLIQASPYRNTSFPALPVCLKAD
jgi:hypothetical protein